MAPFYGSHHLLRPHGTMQGKVRRAVVPFYNVEHFKGSYVRSESHISLILDYQFSACVMRTSGVPQLQVISIERLYGYK